MAELTWSSPKGKFCGAGKEISEAPPRPLYGCASCCTPQPDLAQLLSTTASCRQTSQTCSDCDDAKTFDRAQQRPQAQSKLCLKSRQLLTAPIRNTFNVIATTPCGGLSLSR